MTAGHGHIEAIGGDYVSIAVNCLDDLDPTELAEAPVRFMDRRNNNWWNEPEETRHLQELSRTRDCSGRVQPRREPEAISAKPITRGRILASVISAQAWSG